LGYTRQYYYKLCKTAQSEEDKQQQVLALVKNERKILSRLGTRKLHYLIKEKLDECGIKCGRDKLFTYLRMHDLLIRPKKRYHQTTNSKHWLRKYPNLTSELKLTGAEQLWVSDITYIKTAEGNCYANLLTDAYSRKIVGYILDDNMETASMIPAYEMALKHKQNLKQRTIHHSDRGLQYCSKEYVSLSKANHCLISMTENGDPYENALAERMNKTLKEEFGLGEKIPTKAIAQQLLVEAVALYNNKRPHLSLNYKTPNEVHKKSLISIKKSGTFNYF